MWAVSNEFQISGRFNEAKVHRNPNSPQDWLEPAPLTSSPATPAIADHHCNEPGRNTGPGARAKAEREGVNRQRALTPYWSVPLRMDQVGQGGVAPKVAQPARSDAADLGDIADTGAATSRTRKAFQTGRIASPGALSLATGTVTW